VIHTQRQHPQRARAARHFYRERQVEGIARHAHWAQQAYAEQAQYAPTPFWQVRARQQAPVDVNPLPPPPPPRPDTPLMICPQTRAGTQAVIRGDLIEEIPALIHPSLARPVAFLDDLELLPLLACLMPGESAPHVLARWQRFLPQAHGLRVLDWLWKQRILIPAEGFSSARNAQWPR
ncbi:MAG: hypothetical protein LPK85_07430, partial [Gammaproteobacteria bacterium]|nr:hypothetical protein [Gammaproteobacteria bacterium]